ncbi:MAG: 50S ribosomal protein L7/L12 [Deltaproteobacteria bacterium]|nr:MAG: 50S ribosomal protein L7/L12 [Deltaproteobacteria bacterium]
MADLQAIAENLSSLTVMEAAELVKMLEEKWGVKAASGGAMMMAMPAQAAEAEAAAEPTEFDVVVTAQGPKRLDVIKKVRAITGLGLKEAKDLVDSLPKAVKEALPKEEAEKLKAELEDTGATVELKPVG